MAREKVYSSCEAAVADISDGATVLIGGFAGCGTPRGLIDALARQGAKGLTCVFSPVVTADSPESAGIDRLVANGQIEKVISALPFSPNSGGAVCESWQAGQLEIEVVPQGTLAERLRAAGAGLGAFLSPLAPEPDSLKERKLEGSLKRSRGTTVCLNCPWLPTSRFSGPKPPTLWATWSIGGQVEIGDR